MFSQSIVCLISFEFFLWFCLFLLFLRLGIFVLLVLLPVRVFITLCCFILFSKRGSSVFSCFLEGFLEGVGSIF